MGKVPVVGAKDRATGKVRAKVVAGTDKATLQGLVREAVSDSATVYTDESTSYGGMPFEHEAVNHSVAEYVRGMAHTNGIESFWATLKLAHKGGSARSTLAAT